jgi:hypothetical protein
MAKQAAVAKQNQNRSQQLKPPHLIMQSDKFGEPLPFCEPYWYQGYPSPYYKQGHKDFRAKVTPPPPTAAA